ncbi:MAG TPA: DUF1489 family protein [Alphaproteobacteria bacterium]|nr:DUF1489 family protein [Alphaproteobacteria bacterium]
MIVHLLKPALRCADVHEVALRQQEWQMEHEGRTVYPVWTSRKPTRENDLIDGGSVFWIVKGLVQCRQSIWDIIDYQDEGDEKPSFLILCDPQLIRTQGLPRKPFQGWRYLTPDKAPPDIGPLDVTEERPPAEMEKALREAGLL